jgi:uncharacterized membrane protein (DUF2068 family)
MYGVGFGILSLPTALFVGPHLLAASLGHILFGVMYLIIARGLTRNKAWAWWAGTLLSVAITLLALVALAQSIHAEDWPSVVFYSIATIFFLILLITAVRVRASYVRPT